MHSSFQPLDFTCRFLSGFFYDNSRNVHFVRVLQLLPNTELMGENDNVSRQRLYGCRVTPLFDVSIPLTFQQETSFMLFEAFAWLLAPQEPRLRARIRINQITW